MTKDKATSTLDLIRKVLQRAFPEQVIRNQDAVAFVDALDHVDGQAMHAAVDVALERLRQVTVERFDALNDDQYAAGELVRAAAAYLRPSVRALAPDRDLLERLDNFGGAYCAYRDPWPWQPTFDKRDTHDRRRQLVIAAALICAEIDRIDRQKEGNPER